MNSQPFVIVTQAPFSTFDHMVIGIMLLIVMSILGARRVVRLVTARNDRPQTENDHDPR